jgi:hypothetical protein
MQLRPLLSGSWCLSFCDFVLLMTMEVDGFGKVKKLLGHFWFLGQDLPVQHLEHEKKKILTKAFLLVVYVDTWNGDYHSDKR